MCLLRIVAPAVEPITVADVITYLRLDATNLEPVPTAPTVALAGAGAGGVDNGTHRYRLTFKTGTGETDGGTISAAVIVADKTVNGKVQLTNLSVGGAAVTARNIYRTLANGVDY